MYLILSLMIALVILAVKLKRNTISAVCIFRDTRESGLVLKNPTTLVVGVCQVKEEYAVKYVCEFIFHGDNGNVDGTFTAWDSRMLGILFPMDKVEEFNAIKAIIDSKKFNIGFAQKTPKDTNPFGRYWGLCLLSEGSENELVGVEILK